MQLESLKAYAARPDSEELFTAVAAATNGDEIAQARVCGAMVWCAFAAPAAIGDVFDVICAAQLQKSRPDIASGTPEVTLPDEFWRAFEITLTGPKQGYDATSITLAVASLAASLDPGYGSLAEAAALKHPGAEAAATKPVPAMISLDELAAQPSDSLARELLSMLVDNGFDAEVLDREAIGLQNLSPALRYLNTRILQMHDIWHLSAGYETTSLHEMAISAFQLAQFGHNYSAMFLSTISTMSYLRQPQGFVLMMQNIAEAWQHGRQSPSFMAIEWEQEWHQDLDTIRQKFGIRPFTGSFPPNFLEQLATA